MSQPQPYLEGYLEEGQEAHADVQQHFANRTSRNQPDSAPQQTWARKIEKLPFRLFMRAHLKVSIPTLTSGQTMPVLSLRTV